MTELQQYLQEYEPITKREDYLRLIGDFNRKHAYLIDPKKVLTKLMKQKAKVAV